MHHLVQVDTHRLRLEELVVAADCVVESLVRLCLQRAAQLDEPAQGEDVFVLFVQFEFFWAGVERDTSREVVERPAFQMPYSAQLVAQRPVDGREADLCGEG